MLPFILFVIFAALGVEYRGSSREGIVGEEKVIGTIEEQVEHLATELPNMELT